MVKAKKISKKPEKKKAKKEEEQEEMSLDDAFADDSDVTYAESKPRKEKKKKMDEEELEEEIEEAEEEEEKISKAINGSDNNDSTNREITFKTSKPVAKIKKGDKISVDGIQYEVDQHYVLIDHGSTKEMAIEIFNPKTDKDYQLRYFSDQIESTIEFYELQEIIYVKKPFKKVEW